MQLYFPNEKWIVNITIVDTTKLYSISILLVRMVPHSSSIPWLAQNENWTTEILRHRPKSSISTKPFPVKFIEHRSVYLFMPRRTTRTEVGMYLDRLPHLNNGRETSGSRLWTIYEWDRYENDVLIVDRSGQMNRQIQFVNYSVSMPIYPAGRARKEVLTSCLVLC